MRSPGVQVLQGVQFETFSVVLKLSTQLAHVRFVVGLPLFATTALPGAQIVQGAHTVLVSPSSSQLPFAHVCFGVAPPGQYVPGSQAEQTGGAVGVAATACSVPAAQAPAGRHANWFGDAAYVPSTHGAHRRSAVALGSTCTKFPGTQSLQDAHAAAFEVDVKVPIVQSVHVLSTAVAPSCATACPATHTVFGTQAVAGAPSWSQVPAAQVAFGAAPPAQ